MESVEPPEDDVTPDEDDWRSDEDEEDEEDEDDEEVELSDVDEVEEEVDGEGDDEVLVPVLLAVVSASDCNVPTRANTPAVAASVTAAVAAAMRRLPLRTAAAAPRSLTVMTVPLRSDSLSRTTVGDQPERSL
ncbi:hypothetical protein OH768_15060 [Streptomyces sp. NBC_01622]|uniref:hypothetical protein n=1 Tax=Streptomyces sp. NBC_01622 TaxID=2975903 RepID=UPI00386AC189|nr:hypothetical protein OH768_15060 [Streptomyces sp. NBC_01622]